MSIFQALLLASLPMTLLSSKVVTGFDCEITGSNEKDWGATVYGKNGGRNGGSGEDGRLFEFDCQTDYCYDSEGERNHYWVTCGYSWQDSFDLDDSDNVIVDVLTQASRDKGNCPSAYKNHYTRALNIDSTGWSAKDTEGNQHYYGFHFCYKSKTWLDVKKDQDQVVTDMYAGSKEISGWWTFIGQWDTHDNGKAMGYGDGIRTGGWLFLYAKKSYPETHECPVRWELTFTGKRNGECQQSTTNEGEYGYQTGQTMNSCAKECLKDKACFAFDFKDGSCYLNSRCDFQDEGDGYISCKLKGTGARYEHISPGCVYGYNIVKYQGKTVGECKGLCDARSDCLAFEYGVNHGGSGTTYDTNDCQLQSSTSIGGCDGAEANLDLYIKPTTISSDSESKVASIRSENDRLKYVNEALKKALEAMAN